MPHRYTLGRQTEYHEATKQSAVKLWSFMMAEVLPRRFRRWQLVGGVGLVIALLLAVVHNKNLASRQGLRQGAIYRFADKWRLIVTSNDDAGGFHSACPWRRLLNPKFQSTKN